MCRWYLRNNKPMCRFWILKHHRKTCDSNFQTLDHNANDNLMSYVLTCCCCCLIILCQHLCKITGFVLFPPSNMNSKKKYCSIEVKVAQLWKLTKLTTKTRKKNSSIIVQYWAFNPPFNTIVWIEIAFRTDNIKTEN